MLRRNLRLLALSLLLGALIACVGGCSTLAGLGKDLTAAANGLSAALTDDTRAASKGREKE